MMINEIKNYDCQSTYSYTLGMSLTIEALKGAGNCVERLILSSKVRQNEHLEQLLTLANDLGIEVVQDDKLIKALSIKENCYCIGIFKKFKRSLKSNEHLLLYQFKDEGDLGTTLRSAISFDFKDIVLIGDEVDYFSPKTIRASMGAIFHTNIVVFPSFEAYLKQYPNQKLYPLIADAKTELKKANITSPYSIVLPYAEMPLNVEMLNNAIYIQYSREGQLGLEALSTIVLHELYQRKR